MSVVVVEVLRRLRELLAGRLARRMVESRLLLVAMFFVSMWLLSATLFYYAEHVAGGVPIDFWTSLYWSLITMATVGYGDVVPRTGLGRLVASATAVLGIVAYTLTVSVLADAFLERSMRRAMGQAPLKGKEVLVVGGSETCWELVDELVANGLGDRVGWLVDRQPASRPPVDFYVGDPMRAEDLRRAGVEGASHVILCLGDDSKALHVALLVRRLNPKAKIHAIVRSGEIAELLREAGAATVLSTGVLGRAIASAIFEPSVVKFVEEAVSVRGVADVAEIESRGLEGLTLVEAEERLTRRDRRYRYQVIGIVRQGQLILAPNPREEIRRGDRLLVLRARKDENLKLAP